MRRGKFNILIGAQAGSEAKGKFSAFVANKYRPDIIAMAASPNAGHTVVVDGKKYVSYHLPVAAAIYDAPIVLGPTSLINVPNLLKEMEALEIEPNRVHIDRKAAVITQELVEMEEGNNLSDIGSTLQGISTTRIAKIRRDGSVRLVEDEPQLTHMLSNNTPTILNDAMDKGKTVLCEMTQGFDLDLEHSMYPYCTSKMINPAMGMAEAGVSPNRVGDIYGVFRPYPIRVNNRTGTSGPYPGAVELDWTGIGKACGHPNPDELREITTTTKLPRRVFSFSWERFAHFVRVCRPDMVCMQFANYLDWGCYGEKNWFNLPESVKAFVDILETKTKVKVGYIGTGPEQSEMVDRGLDTYL